jgi:hypothetical protein
MADNSLAVRDPYLWHNDDVLKNLLEIHDVAQLRKAELAFSAARVRRGGGWPRWRSDRPRLACRTCATFTARCFRISTAGPVNCVPSTSGATTRPIATVSTSRTRAMR